jgi:hypothetical protein
LRGALPFSARGSKLAKTRLGGHLRLPTARFPRAPKPPWSRHARVAGRESAERIREARPYFLPAFCRIR